MTFICRLAVAGLAGLPSMANNLQQVTNNEPSSRQEPVEQGIQIGKLGRKGRVVGNCLFGFVQVYRIGQERHRKAVLFILIGIGQLEAVYLLVDLIDDLPDSRLIRCVDL